MPQDFTIRQATPDDARPIAEVHVETWRDAYDGLMPDDALENLSADDREQIWSQRIDEADEERHEIWVVEREDDQKGKAGIAGFCSFGPGRDEADAADAAGEVYAIYVDPAAQGEWLGHSLLAAAETRMRANGYPGAYLWVLEDNEAARGFYENCDWESDGATKTDERDAMTLEEVRYRRNF